MKTGIGIGQKPNLKNSSKAQGKFLKGLGEWPNVIASDCLAEFFIECKDEDISCGPSLLI